MLASHQGGLSSEPGPPMTRGAPPQRGLRPHRHCCLSTNVLERTRGSMLLDTAHPPLPAAFFPFCLFHKPFIGVQHITREKARILGEQLDEQHKLTPKSKTEKRGLQDPSRPVTSPPSTLPRGPQRPPSVPSSPARSGTSGSWGDVECSSGSVRAQCCTGFHHVTATQRMCPSSADGHLGCFHPEAIVHAAALTSDACLSWT